MTTTLLQHAWSQLEAAARSRSPFNFLQLATIGLDGAPELRTVVLRRCDVRAGTLSFVTDLRSPKVAEIRRDPRVSLVGFDGAGSTQLRLSGTAAIVEDEAEKRSVWEALRNRTLVLFDAPLAPGTGLDEHGAALGGNATADASADPYDRFALVAVTLARIEWLDLSAEPHRRHAFVRLSEGWHGTRLAP